MTEKEFIRQLSEALEGHGSAIKKPVLSEYQRYFELKRADGYGEEEICSALRSPAEIVNVREGRSRLSPAVRTLVMLGLTATDLFAVLFMMIASAVGLGAAALCAALICAGGRCFLGFPPLPAVGHYALVFRDYWSGALMGLSLIALGALGTVGGIYYFSFVKQLVRSLVRFNLNALAEISGKPILPPVSVNACVGKKLNRRLRSAALISILAFELCFALGFACSALAAGSIDFWRVWHWFS